MTPMKRKRNRKVSDQLRQAILDAPTSRRQIALRLGIDEGQFSRFMNHKGGLSMEGIDAAAELLGLELRPIKRCEDEKEVTAWRVFPENPTVAARFSLSAAMASGGRSVWGSATSGPRRP